MANPVKTAVRWLFENYDKLFGPFAMILLSTMAGVGSESVWIGIFIIPMFLVGIFLFAVVTTPVVYGIYYLCAGINWLFKRTRHWAYN